MFSGWISCQKEDLNRLLVVLVNDFGQAATIKLTILDTNYNYMYTLLHTTFELLLNLSETLHFRIWKFPIETNNCCFEIHYYLSRVNPSHGYVRGSVHDALAITSEIVKLFFGADQAKQKRQCYEELQHCHCVL